MSANERAEKNGKVIDLAEETDFALGRLTIKPSSREVVLDGKVETLEPRVMQVLIALARRSGEVVSRDQLVELCWGGRAVSEDALNRSMTRVRRLAADSTFALDTIPRVGYRLTPMSIPVEAPQPVPSTTSREALAAPSRWRRIRWAVLALLALIVAGGAYGAWQYSLLNRPYFAVLPFDVAGTDQDATQLAETMPTAIGSVLSTQGYKVVSPAVSARYRGERKAAAAAELEPLYIVDGHVRVDGDRLRIAARIDSAIQPVTVWSQDFEMPREAAGELQNTIATSVANLFNPGIKMLFQESPEVVAALMRIGTRTRAGDDMGAFVGARELIRKHSTSVSARIFVGTTTGPALDLLPVGERANALASARELTEKAAREAWGRAPIPRYALTPPVEWSQREELLRTGLTSDYTDASGLRRLLAMHLATTGRTKEALAISQQAMSVDRLSLFNTTTHAAVLDALGRGAEADATLARAQRLWPANEFVERARFSSALARADGTAAALLSDATVAAVLDPQAERHPLPLIARALETRAPADIDAVAVECADPARIARERARFCLHALVLLGRLDTFFELAPAYFPEMRGATPEQRDRRWLAEPSGMGSVRVLFRKDMRAVRADARFIPIVERSGLLDYWRRSGKWPDFCSDESESVCARMRDSNGS